MERYIAIDNKCLWPQLIAFENGAIGVVGFNEPCHGTWPGEVQSWVSADGGRTWQTRGVPVPRDEGEIRMNHGTGLAPDGSWLCVVSGYSGWKRSPAAKEDVRDYVLTYGDYWKSLGKLPARVARSWDQGATWEIIGGLPVMEGWQDLIPFGKIQTGADGHLRMMAYTAMIDGGNDTRQAFFLRSRDGGVTWEIQSEVPSRGTTETATLHVGGGRWVSASRRVESHGGELLVGYVSGDDGATWTGGEVLGIRDSFPAWLVLWQDRLLLLHGNRAEGNLGVVARVFDSVNHGWTSPRRLVELGGDLGYPSAVVNSTGELVIAYYASDVPAHRRYHMGVLILTAEEFGLSEYPPFAMPEKIS